jgi:predicted dinucleotide-binding enzyme
MGVHLAAAWAHAGYHVTICGRDKAKADPIVASLKSGAGYSEGEIIVPGFDNYRSGSPSEKWKLFAGTNEDAASAEVIVLAAPFHVMWKILGPLAPSLRGQGKIFLDLTNPWLNTSAPEDPSKVPPIPLDQPQSSVQFHKALFNDETSRWCMCYRHVFWMLVHPTGPNPRSGVRRGIEVLGDSDAVVFCEALIKSHGFNPVIRSRTGCEAAPSYEISFKGRVQPNGPPPPGSDSDGLIGPFTASPMIAFDVIAVKFMRLFKCCTGEQPEIRCETA